MAKTSKVKNVKGVREYDGQNGKVFYFQIEMENEDSGSIGKKKADAIKVGDELTYELEVTDKGNKIKPVQSGNGFGGGLAKALPQAKDASFSLSYAKDLIIALIESGDLPEESRNADGLVKSTLWVADRFNKWLKDNN